MHRFLLLTIAFLYPLMVFALVDRVGFIIKPKVDLYSEHQLQRLVATAIENQRVLIVRSKFNNNRSQKINLGGYNYWIHLSDMVIVDYPKHYGNNNIDPNRKRILKNYLNRIFSY